jgi:hypothetical protein
MAKWEKVVKQAGIKRVNRVTLSLTQQRRRSIRRCEPVVLHMIGNGVRIAAYA